MPAAVSAYFLNGTRTYGRP